MYVLHIMWLECNDMHGGTSNLCYTCTDLNLRTQWNNIDFKICDLLQLKSKVQFSKQIEELFLLMCPIKINDMKIPKYNILI